LLKLYLYGYLNQIRSSRRLDATYSTDYQAIHIEGLLLNNLLWGHNLFHKPGTSGQAHKFVVGVQEHLAGKVVMQFDMPDATQVGATCGTEYK
jgi:transposase